MDSLVALDQDTVITGSADGLIRVRKLIAVTVSAVLLRPSCSVALSPYASG